MTYTTERVQITDIHYDPMYAFYIKTADGVPVVGGSMTTEQIKEGVQALKDGFRVDGEFVTVTGYRYLQDLILYHV